MLGTNIVADVFDSETSITVGCGAFTVIKNALFGQICPLLLQVAL